MKDPTYQIRKHYIDLLAGISVDVVNIATFDKEPPFVFVSTRSQEQSTKTSESHQVTTTFNIIVKNDGDWGGDKQAEDIANEILPLVKNGSYGSTTDFKIVTCMIESSDPISETTETGRVIQKVIAVNNYVSRLN